MITLNVFNGDKRHPLVDLQNQHRDVGRALEELVSKLSFTHYMYGAWIEDIQLGGDNPTVKIGHNGMGGEMLTWVYRGPHAEILPLAEVCLLFYGTHRKGSDLFRTKMEREVYLRRFQAAVPVSITTRPLHGGYPVAIAA